MFFLKIKVHIADALAIYQREATLTIVPQRLIDISGLTTSKEIWIALKQMEEEKLIRINMSVVNQFFCLDIDSKLRAAFKLLFLSVSSNT